MRRLLTAILAFLSGSSVLSAELPLVGTGDLTNVDDYLRRLVRAPDHGVLVIEAPGPDRFLNLSAADGKAQMDFPLVTDVQRSREEVVRTFFRDRGLPYQETAGTDGSRFIDCWLPSEPAAAAEIVRAALVTVFDANEMTELTFRASGIAVADPAS